MNTDNITISGETIDYLHLWTITTKEPYLALLTHKVVMHMEINHIWPHGISRLAESLIPILHEDDEEALKIAQDEISKFSVQYENHWFLGMKRN